jgi:hypothetical protein
MILHFHQTLLGVYNEWVAAAAYFRLLFNVLYPCLTLLSRSLRHEMLLAYAMCTNENRESRRER